MTFRRRLLVVAWEYPGVNSRQGAALARRIGQIVRGFAASDWHVDVLHYEHPNVNRTITHHEGIRLHPVKGPGVHPSEEHARALRRIATAWHGAIHGDRSGQWARGAMRQLGLFDAAPPTVVIGCFTPRGPLAVARAAAGRWRVPWLADLQDPALEGSSDRLAPFVRQWMRRVLRDANTVVQVSPEWAQSDSQVLAREVVSIRHAVPSIPPAEMSLFKETVNDFVLLHAGSVHFEHRSPRPLLDALARLNSGPGPRTVLELAGREEAYEVCRRAAPSEEVRDSIRFLGWLNAADLAQAMYRADCLVVLPSNEAGRPLVPSKLYEYLGTNQPVLIAGPDCGGMVSLYRDWEHHNVTNATDLAIEDAIRRAQNRDYTRLLRRHSCGRAPIAEEDLTASYMQLAERALSYRNST